MTKRVPGASAQPASRSRERRGVRKPSSTTRTPYRGSIRCERMRHTTITLTRLSLGNAKQEQRGKVIICLLSVFADRRGWSYICAYLRSKPIPSQASQPGKGRALQRGVALSDCVRIVLSSDLLTASHATGWSSEADWAHAFFRHVSHIINMRALRQKSVTEIRRGRVS